LRNDEGNQLKSNFHEKFSLFLEDKPFPPILPEADASSQVNRDPRSIDSVKYLHSKVIGIGSGGGGKRESNFHSSLSSSSSSSSASGSNFVFSSGSGGSTSTFPQQQHSHHNSHHRDKHRHSHFEQESDNNNDSHENDNNNNVDNHEISHGNGNGDELPQNVHGNDDNGGESKPIQEKLRSSKGTSSSSSGGSSGSSSSSSSGGMIGGDSHGLDHHHLNTQVDRKSESLNSNNQSEFGFNEESHHHRHQNHQNQQHQHSHQNQGDGQFSGLSPPREQQEKLLLQQLMRGYERDVRPVRNASQSVVVRVGITLTQIFDMVSKFLKCFLQLSPAPSKVKDWRKKLRKLWNPQNNISLFFHHRFQR